jgi:hypothetical protein
LGQAALAAATGKNWHVETLPVDKYLAPHWYDNMFPDLRGDDGAAGPTPYN